MHDYFEILGVSRNARPTEIRRACGRVRATHPDIRVGEPPACPPGAGLAALRTPRELAPDAAIDFVDASSFVDAMRAAFFADASSS